MSTQTITFAVNNALDYDVRYRMRLAVTFVVFHFFERPIKRAARKIAYSGHWGY